MCGRVVRNDVLLAGARLLHRGVVAGATTLQRGVVAFRDSRFVALLRKLVKKLLSICIGVPIAVVSALVAFVCRELFFLARVVAGLAFDVVAIPGVFVILSLMQSLVLIARVVPRSAMTTAVHLFCHCKHSSGPLCCVAP